MPHWRNRRMRNSVTEKAEIIRTVEALHLPAKQTLNMLDIPRSMFYRWYDLWLDDGIEALADQSTKPKTVWNKIVVERLRAFIEFALGLENNQLNIPTKSIFR